MKQDQSKVKKVRYEGDHPHIKFKVGQARYDHSQASWLFQPEDSRDWYRVAEISLIEI